MKYIWEGSNLKFHQVILISLISGFTGILLCQLILPVFTSTFQKSLTEIGIVDSANLMSWSAILMTLFGLIFTILMLSNQYKLKIMVKTLSISFIYSIIILCLESFLFLLIESPEIFINTNLTLKIVKFFSYPSLVSLYLETFQPIWIISTILFLFVFNLCFYYLTEMKQ